ncbi:hypothetical protein KFL_007530090, partial [Klebsormidium nitens]
MQDLLLQNNKATKFPSLRNLLLLKFIHLRLLQFIMQRMLLFNNLLLAQTSHLFLETHIRFSAARATTSEALETGARMSHEHLERVQDLIDEGMSFLESRMQFYEIADAESWPVAMKMEEEELVLDLSEEKRKRLKKAKDEIKEEAREKAQSKKKSSVPPKFQNGPNVTIGLWLSLS